MSTFCQCSEHLRIIGVTYRHYIDPMAGKEWNDDTAYAMNHIKWMTWPVGFWPLQVYDTFSLIRCIWSIVASALMTILPLLEIYLGCTDTEKNTDCVMFISAGIMGVVKNTCFRIYLKNLTSNCSSAVEDYQTVKDPSDLSVMRKHTYIGRLLFYSMTSFAFPSCILYILIPLVGEGEYLNTVMNKTMLLYPVPAECGMEHLHPSRIVYRILYIFVGFSLLTSNQANIGIDVMFLNVMLHLCGQMKILNSKFVDCSVEKSRVDSFTTLIERHIYLINRAKELIDTVNFFLLVKLFIMSILLCIMGFQCILAMKMNNYVIVWKSLTVLCSFLTQLTLYCFTGEYLKSQMEKVATSIYQSEWYEFPEQAKRSIIFIIMRRGYPVSLQAGHFIFVNLTTYMSILKSSLSYISILRVMVEP